MNQGNQHSLKIINEDCFFDIIGDIHGSSNELEDLLEKLGYYKDFGIWQHFERKAIFVGDFIDRGPNSREVLKTIRNMVEFNHAYAILGNHELNLIMYITKENGKSIRKPSESSRRLLDKVKEEFADDMDLLKDHVKWLRKLPLYIDFGKFRVVHAYWNDKYIELIENYREGGKLKKQHLKNIADPDHPLSIAVTRITKGIELKLPEDIIIKDSRNISRNNFRIKWWESPENKTFRSISFANKFTLPDYTVPHQLLFPFDIYTEDMPLVFFGHYCMNRNYLSPKPNICCVDACVANGGALMAYRWSGESEVKLENFVFVQPAFSFF